MSSICLLALTLAVGISHSAHAQQGSFTRLHLPEQISVEVPAHWKVLSQDARSNFSAAGNALIEGLGETPTGTKKQTLLAVNATPEPRGAMVRLSVSKPPDYTDEDLKGATPSDLKEVQVQLSELYRKLGAAGGPTILEVHPVTLATVGGRRALAISYRRMGGVGSSPWHVILYRVPVRDGLVEFTLSYRESDAFIWRPILEKVKRSIQF